MTAHGGSAERRQGHERGLKASPKAPTPPLYIYACVREGVAGGGETPSATCGMVGGAWRRTKKKPQHLLASAAARIEIGDYALFRVCLNAAVTNLASQCEVSDR